MLNEILKTAEELNAAALHYRQSGNMDGVRELAKAHAVSRKQTEAFIQGSRYRLVEIPIGERKFVNASEKLRAEMFTCRDVYFKRCRLCRHHRAVSRKSCQNGFGFRSPGVKTT